MQPPTTPITTTEIKAVRWFPGDGPDDIEEVKHKGDVVYGYFTVGQNKMLVKPGYMLVTDNTGHPLWAMEPNEFLRYWEEKELKRTVK